MMHERELLALAAKAMDGRIKYSDFSDKTPDRWEFKKNRVWVEWDPLDDNDASRNLQVMLGISVIPYPFYSMPKHSVIAKRQQVPDVLRTANPTEVIVQYGNDPEAATRLAVLRCAAEIGKLMMTAKED